MFRSEIGSGLEDPGGTPPPRIPKSTPPGVENLGIHLSMDSTQDVRLELEAIHKRLHASSNNRDDEIETENDILFSK